MRKIVGDYVLFYGDDLLSNFSKSVIMIEDQFLEDDLFHEGDVPLVFFDTAEAFYQAQKAVIANDRDKYYKIMHAKTPAEAKRIGRRVKLDANEWDRIKDDIMTWTVALKFSNEILKSYLLSPQFDGKTFVEVSPTDKYWGATYNEDTGEIVGGNRLGKILTKIRLNELKKKG